MRASCSLEIPNAFLLEEDHLKKSCKLLEERIGNLRIRAACADHVEREFKDAADLAAYENTKAAEIRTVNLAARSDNYEKEASLVFCGNDGYRHRISLEIAADTGVLMRLKTDLL